MDTAEAAKDTPEVVADHSQTHAGISVIRQLNQAINQHDVDAILSVMAQDCVFENTYPPPEGTRYEGQVAIRRFWEEFFRSSPQAQLEEEEIFAYGDRCVLRWLYRWSQEEGSQSYVRGADIYRLKDGKVQEKLSYVKG